MTDRLREAQVSNTTRIAVDLGRCQGYANCVITAPDVFDLGQENKAEVVRPEVVDTDPELVEEAVRACPVSAIRLERS